MKNTLKLMVIFLAGIAASGCEQDGPAERAGEALDNAAADIREGGEDLRNKIEDACEDIKDGAGAQDKDC